ncbi:MAG: HAD family hydrolase, partial [Planctomycetota bacterium]
EASGEDRLLAANSCLLEDNKRLLRQVCGNRALAGTSLKSRVIRLISGCIRIFVAAFGLIKNPSALCWWLSRRLFPLHLFPIRVFRSLGRRLCPIYIFTRRVLGYLRRQIFRLRAEQVKALPDFLVHTTDYDSVAFDIFDTLLRRDIEPPDLSKRPTAKRAELLFSSRGIPLSEDHFTYQRDRAENELRAEALAGGYDTECRLDDIFRRALSRILGQTPAESDVQHLVDYELQYDIEHLELMPGCLELLRQLKQANKTVIAVSDMYYGKQHLDRIFSALGMDASIDHVFVSSEDKIAKHTTRLFSKVLKDLKITPGQIIHLGDNLHSDVRSPSHIGIKAVWFNSSDELTRRGRLKRDQESISISHALESDTSKSQSEPKVQGTPTDQAGDLDEFRQMGRDYFGPTFCAFTLNLIDSVIRDQSDDVYFLSRDGDIFMKMYNLLKDSVRRYQDLPIPEARYLYVSRRSTTLPACIDMGQREYEIACMDPQDCGPNALLRKLGLQEEAFAEIVQKYFPGKAKKHRSRSQDKRRFEQLFNDKDFRERVESHRQKAVEVFKSYLDQEAFWGAQKRNAIVDIGWNATVQVNITKAFFTDPQFPITKGYYYGRDYAALNDYTLSEKSIYPAGFAFDNIRYQPIAYFMPLFEFASCAEQGSTLGYMRKDSGRIEPVLDADYRHRPEQKALQEGILSFAQGFAERYNHYEPDVHALQNAAVEHLKHLAFYPSRSQVKALRRVVIDADWGGQGQHTL